MLNSAPPLDRHYEPGKESTPEATRCVGHLVIPAYCGNTSALLRKNSTAATPSPQLKNQERVYLESGKVCFRVIAYLFVKQVIHIEMKLEVK